MTGYTVRWEIDIDADTPEEAATRARAIQLDPDSAATFFEVLGQNGEPNIEVDVWAEPRLR
jgi:hypothetical protein